MHEPRDVDGGLRVLAISDTGFIFDPGSGHSYTVNQTGLLVLRSLREGKSTEEIATILGSDGENQFALQDDVREFVARLSELGITASHSGRAS